MKNFSVATARTMLRQVVQSVEAPAVDYIDWSQFELELDELMAREPTKDQVKRVFAKATTRARQKYHAAALNGGHFKGRKPN